MKQGFASLNELAAELTRQSGSKQDFVAPTTALSMLEDGTLNVPSAGALPIAELGHTQLAEYTGIPKLYYDRVRAADASLLAGHVNHWLGAKRTSDGKPERRMVRALDGHVRALLSDRYQRIDNYEVAEVALNVLQGVADLEVVSTAVTESRLYLKAVSKSMRALVPGSRRVGDFVEAGVMISNSEVGLGSVSIQPFAHFLVCTNGMVRNKEGLRAQHVGRRIDTSLEGLLSDNTKRLQDAAVLSKVRDVIAHAFAEAPFRRFIDQLEATTKESIEGDVSAAVEVLGPTLGLSQGERQGVLRHLITGGDLSRYGLMNAVTRTAEDVGSYDRATELEAAGFRLIELPQKEWHAISRAKPLELAA